MKIWIRDGFILNSGLEVESEPDRGGEKTPLPRSGEAWICTWERWKGFIVSLQRDLQACLPFYWFLTSSPTFSLSSSSFCLVEFCGFLQKRPRSDASQALLAFIGHLLFARIVPKARP